MQQEKVNFEKMRSTVFFGIIVLLAIAFLYLIKPFIYPIFWAAVLAVTFHPVHAWFHKKIGIPGLSAFMTELFIVVAILLPLALVVMLVIGQSVDLYHSVATGSVFENVDKISTQLKDTAVGPYIDSIEMKLRENAPTVTQTVSTVLFRQATAITTDSVRFIFMLFLMLYTLYYFLKEGKVLLNRIMHLSPLGHENEEVLYERFTSTARATMKGTFIIGGIQGILGALLFFITGIKGAFVWGVIMTLLSIIPGIGSFIIWFPAGIIQLALGNLWQGLTILLFGTFVISLIDNLLRPPLVGKDIQMHPLIVLFSTLGGLALFGISGFIIGPIIAALFLSVLSIYDFYYKKELNRN